MEFNSWYMLNEDGTTEPVWFFRTDPITGKEVLNEVYAKWFEETENRIIVQHDLTGVASVSTVFMGLNHRYGDGPPILFETMVFPFNTDDVDSHMDMFRQRYETKVHALMGHAVILLWVSGDQTYEKTMELLELINKPIAGRSKS